MPRIDDNDGGHGPEWKLDVFVSFRGEELRKSFASHLFKALRDAGIEFFRDDDEREIGEKINPKLVDGIRRSRVSLALFSPRYGESRWCLNELVEMLEFHEKNKHCGHVFMPVFYRVRAGDVRKRTGEFGSCFEEYCKEIRADDSQIETWRKALAEAGSTSGWRLDGQCESEFIVKIAEHISNIIPRFSSPCVAEDVIPIDSQVEEVISLLKMSPSQCEELTRVIGIYGNRGTGKTTLAGMVSDRLRFEFEGFSFLQLDDEPNRDNHIYLQKKLLLDVFKVNLPHVYDLISNCNEIKKKLRHKKLLIVLDNVTSKDQVRHFGINDRSRCLSSGSRIIITTRHRHVLDDLCVDEKYEVNKMDRSDSLRLFSRLVFGSDRPEEGFEELCESILDISNIRPSDLVDLASVLSRRAKESWSEGIEKWKKKRRVFCRNLMERVLPKRPIPHSCERRRDADDPSYNVGRMPFLSKPIHDFLKVDNLRSDFATLLIGHPEGHVLMIPLSKLGGIIDSLSETWVTPSNIFNLVKESGYQTAEQQNDRFNAMKTWVSLFRKMGIVEPRKEAACLTWEGTGKASSSRFTEYVGAQSHISHFTCNATEEEDKPGTDPTLHSKEVLNKADRTSPSEKVEPTLEAESTSTQAVDQVYAGDNGASPLSKNSQQITTPVRQSSSDEEKDNGGVPDDFPLLRGYGGGRELLTSLPSPPFLLSEFPQAEASVQISLGSKRRLRWDRNRRR